jgi:cell fate regulator YaaT (PSP1 superfamily)
MESIYLVRYGRMGHVGSFKADLEALERGRTVVVASPRGTELGEILAPLFAARAVPGGSRVVRNATSDDLQRAARAEGDRIRCLTACEHVFGDGVWPLAVIDAEPLLDERRAVLYYLGPHHLDTAALRQTFRERFDLDVAFEPVGLDEQPSPGYGAPCGSGGCGEGGCGSDPGAGGHSCDGCAVKTLLRTRRPSPCAI